jgi:hypothetical protein
MAVSPPRERRAAIWPWLLMPAIVLLVFYALFRVHHPRTPAVTEPAPAARSADGS